MYFFTSGFAYASGLPLSFFLIISNKMKLDLFHCLCCQSQLQRISGIKHCLVQSSISGSQLQHPTPSSQIFSTCGFLLCWSALSQNDYSVQFSSVQQLSRVRLFVTPWTAAHQVSLSITNSQSLLKFMSIESVMPSNHLILCHPLLSGLQSFPTSESFPMSQLFA